MKKGSVVFGHIYGQIEGAFLKSLVALQNYDKVHHNRLNEFIHCESGSFVHRGRNQIVEQFLDDSSGEWLLMIDSDMSFARTTVDRLIETAVREKVKIVGGLCFAAGGGWVVPTMGYSEVINGKRVEKVAEEWAAGTVWEVDRTGTGCILIHREVLEHFRREFPKLNTWFGLSEEDGVELGEDITFCKRAQSLGYKIIVDTGVSLGHMKTGVIDENTFNSFKQARKKFGFDALQADHIRRTTREDNNSLLVDQGPRIQQEIVPNRAQRRALAKVK